MVDAVKTNKENKRINTRKQYLTLRLTTDKSSQTLSVNVSREHVIAAGVSAVKDRLLVY